MFWSQEFPSEVWKLLAEVPIFIVVCRKASLSRLHAIKEQCPWATAVLPVLCEQGEEDEEGESMPMYAQVKAQMQDLCRETERHLPELPKSFQLEASEAELEVVVHRNDSNDHQTDDINGINDIDLRAHRFITVFSALAAAAGATPATPAPFMDFVLLLCILRTMLLDLARTYDIQIQPSEALKLLSFQMNGLSICICLAIMLGSFLKLHPDWGAVGNLTNAIIASWFTAAIGFLFQEIFRRMSRSPLDFYVMKPQEQKNYFFQQFQMWFDVCRSHMYLWIQKEALLREFCKWIVLFIWRFQACQMISNNDSR